MRELDTTPTRRCIVTHKNIKYCKARVYPVREQENVTHRVSTRSKRPRKLYEILARRLNIITL